MKLFYTKRSPYARKALIIALEKNISLELIEENLMQKSDLLIKTNPLSKVPALILDSGETICDSPVICEYLDSLKPSPSFFPKEGKERFKILTLAAYADGLMDVTVGMFMEKARHPDNFDAKFIEAQEKTIQRTLEYFEKNIKEFSDFHIASVALASALGYLALRFPNIWPSNNAPQLKAWFDKVSQRPSLQQTIPIQT